MQLVDEVASTGPMNSNPDSPRVEQEAGQRQLTRAELSKHCTPEDLWISIQGKVYDVTHWLAKHPGGDLPLLALAGQDVTDAFLAFHPGSAWSFLPQFLVGKLADYEVSPLAAEHRKLLAQLKSSPLFRNPVHVYRRYAAVMLIAFVLAILGVVYSTSVLVHLCSAVLLGLVWHQSGFMGHDIGHCGMVGHPVVDLGVGLLVGNILTGISMAWWTRNHNAHHLSCNSIEYDPDLQYMPIFTLTPKLFNSLHSYFYDREMTFDAATRLLVRYQHWAFYPVMAVARINLHAQTFLLLLSKRRIPHRLLELACVGVFWLWFLSLVSLLPSFAERIAFVFVSYATTGFQHVQFCVNHFSSPIYQGRPESKSWFESQVTGTLNLDTPPWMDWFYGGLQFQIEHHLFPRLPRHNLREIHGIIKPLCEKYGLPYKTVTWWEANKMVIRTLRAAAMEAKDLQNVRPVLLWEALNAKG